MVLFIILAGVLTLLAAAAMARPFLRRMDAPAPPAAYGQTVYRDQLAELERDVARGLLSPQEEQAARAEIGRRMLAAGRDAERKADRTSVPPARILAAIVVIVPLFSIGLYALIGRPGAPDRPLAVRLAAGEAADPACTADLEGALAQLSGDLRRDPENFETRVLLGRVLTRCARFEEAIEHYQAAVELTEGGDNADLLIEYGQTRIMANNGTVDAEAFDLFRRVFEQNPDHLEARLYLGVAMAEYGEYDAARALWESLLEDAPDAPWVGTLRAQLATMPEGSASASAPDIVIPDAAPDATAPAPAPQ